MIRTKTVTPADIQGNGIDKWEGKKTRMEMLFPHYTPRRGCLLPPLLFGIILWVLATEIRQEKETKVTQVGGKSLFADTMVFYLGDSKKY